MMPPIPGTRYRPACGCPAVCDWCRQMERVSEVLGLVRARGAIGEPLSEPEWRARVVAPLKRIWNGGSR